MRETCVAIGTLAASLSAEMPPLKKRGKKHYVFNCTHEAGLMLDQSVRPGVRRDLGPANRERVRRFFAAHIGAKQTECALALRLSRNAVNRHVRDLRAEWRRPQSTKPPRS